MKTILTSVIFLLLVAGSFAAAPNYIVPLDLALRGDFLRVKASTFYRVSQITKLEAIVTTSTPIKGEEPLIQRYPLDDKIILIIQSLRNISTRGYGQSTAKIEFSVNGDLYLIASVSENQLLDELYFERTIKRASDHFERLITMAQTKSEQGGTGQPATRTESKSEGSDKPQPEAEVRSR